MRAMILAAGLGTRLRPLTDNRPKALVEVNGRTLLQHTLARLRSFGVNDVIVNVHYFADLIVDYLEANYNFGMRIEVSREEVLLDTGGGLKKTAQFFLQDDSNEPFILHNVDVISSIDLRRMVQFQVENRALATLAVQHRETSRYLLFDQHCRLSSQHSPPVQDFPGVVSPLRLHPLAFTGIHVISPRIFALMSEQGIFSIIAMYLRLAAQGEIIVGFNADDDYWRDLGTLENLQEVAEDLQHGIVQQ